MRPKFNREHGLLGCAFTFCNVNLTRKSSHAIESSAPMSASLPSDPSNDDVSIGRWPAWQKTPAGTRVWHRLGLAVAIATAGWFYLYFKSSGTSSARSDRGCCLRAMEALPCLHNKAVEVADAIAWISMEKAA